MNSAYTSCAMTPPESGACGCCEGTEPLTPLATANRPGLPALVYRAGTHASFFETMLSRLSRHFLEQTLETLDENGQPETKPIYPLRSLKTRNLADPSIALLDAWASVADVLTFYQERIANEGYLRTAIERRSVLELGRLVGYALRPGVSATGWLAFTLDDGARVTIPAGTKAQSVPGPEELPQVFETAEAFEARAEWNLLKPRMQQPQYLLDTSIYPETGIYVKAVAPPLRRNDPLLLTFTTFQEAGIPCADGSVMDEERVCETFDLYRVLGVEEVKPEAKEAPPAAAAAGNAAAAGAAIVPGAASNPAPLPALPPPPAGAGGGIGATQRLHVQHWRVPKPPFDKSPVDTALEAIFRVLNFYGDFRRFAFSEDSLLVQQAEDVLRKMGGEMDILANDEKSFDQLLSSLRAGMSRLEALRSALDARYNRLLGWYDGLLEELGLLERLLELDASFQEAKKKPELLSGLAERYGELLRELSGYDRLAAMLSGHIQKRMIDARRTHPGLELPNFEAAAINGAGGGGQKRFFSQSFSRDLGKLRQPASVPPPSPQQLRRKAGALYGLDADTPARLLAGLYPEIAAAAYTAWAGKQALAAPPELGKGVLKSMSVFRVKAAFFGHQLPGKAQFAEVPVASPDPEMNVTATVIDHYDPLKIAEAWGGEQIRQDKTDFLFLDREYEGIQPETWIAIERVLVELDLEDEDGNGLIDDEPLTFHKVKEVRSVSMSAGGVSLPVTRLTIDPPWLQFANAENAEARREKILTEPVTLSGTRVFAQAEPMPLEEEPVKVRVEKDLIEVERLYDGLQSGRWLVVSGERADLTTPGVYAAELVMLTNVVQDVQQVDDTAPLAGDPPHTFLKLALGGLAHSYKRSTVKIFANVGRATHGETRRDVLGSGDASRPFQDLTLRQPPLTYIPAPNPRGVESTLEVRVNDLRWRPVSGLSELGPNDRGYTVKIDDPSAGGVAAAGGGKVHVIFGDGQHGARPPTGVENLRAVYRSGIGKPGNVRAGQISMLLTRPLGVKEVGNPIPAAGGADPESRDSARRNIPLALLALDRLVSVQDYADFARTFAGIGKASSLRLTGTNTVHLTIAGEGNIRIPPQTDLYRNLIEALRQHGDPHQPLMVQEYERVYLLIAAKVRRHPDYSWEAVEAKVRSRLLEVFGFYSRELGQDLYSSEVISVIQTVPGVEYVDLDLLDTLDEDRLSAFLAGGGGGSAGLGLTRNEALTANLARQTSAGPRPAQLAYLNPEHRDTLLLTEYL